MAIESAWQQLYTSAKPGLKKAITSSSRKDVAEGEQASALTVKAKVSPEPSLDLQEQKDVFSWTPQFLLSPTVRPPGFRVKLTRWQDTRSICQQLGLMDKRESKTPGLYSGTPFTHNEMVRLRPRAHTSGAFDCNIGVVMNSGEDMPFARKLGSLLSSWKGTLFHLDPKGLSAADKEAIREKLDKDISVLHQNGEVLGFITGGVATSELSRQLNALLVSVFQDAGIKRITQIWGRRYGYATDMIMDASNKTIYLKAVDQVWAASSPSILTISDLIRNFAHIHFAPGDYVETSEGIFTGQEINDAFEKMGRLSKSING